MTACYATGIPVRHGVEYHCSFWAKGAGTVRLTIYQYAEGGRFPGSKLLQTGTVPGIDKWMDAPDIAGLIAPRPLLIEAGVHDSGFFTEEQLMAFDHLQRIYDAAGAGEDLWQDMHPGEPASADYAVAVNRRPVFCYTSYQLHDGSMQTIAGRPVTPVSFCSFDFAGEAQVSVRLLDGLRRAGVDASQVTVRPLALALRPVITGDRLTFRAGTNWCSVRSG
jgi:hypothetical protein